ncbi:CGNR zinc finger domain-containing protein [Pseudomonas baltica]|uniref:CGNR zinc finger domain-containing protein n=1 Tax=Pseudomonas baltica TaxID=2762576 RepID=UPI0028A23D45|nr:CGNR zinc finger domain-containing protein [Pseudomonas baltica]
MPAHNQTAPGELEDVRRFVNSWSIPNQTRIETDQLPQWASDPQAWTRELSRCPLHPEDQLDTLLELRLALRESCANHDHDSEALNTWFDKVPLSAFIESIESVARLRLKPLQSTYRGHILALVANAIASGEWSRLKTCGDCQWAFYDHTRNGNKRWCGMSKGGPDGRACGTIAKVTAFRLRAADKARKAAE